MKMEGTAFRLLPSSHSDDMTLVAKYNSPEAKARAEALARKLIEIHKKREEQRLEEDEVSLWEKLVGDEVPDWTYAEINTSDSEIIVALETDGRTKPFERIFESTGSTNVKRYDSYSPYSLVVLELPCPLESAIPTLDHEEISLIKRLGPPLAHECDGEHHRYKWETEDVVFDDDDDDNIYYGSYKLDEKWMAERLL